MAFATNNVCPDLIFWWSFRVEKNIRLSSFLRKMFFYHPLLVSLIVRKFSWKKSHSKKLFSWRKQNFFLSPLDFCSIFFFERAKTLFYFSIVLLIFCVCCVFLFFFFCLIFLVSFIIFSICPNKNHQKKKISRNI